MAQNESYYLVVGKFQYTLSPVHFEANFQAFMIDLSRYGGLGRNFVDATNGGVLYFTIFLHYRIMLLTNMPR